MLCFAKRNLGGADIGMKLVTLLRLGISAHRHGTR